MTRTLKIRVIVEEHHDDPMRAFAVPVGISAAVGVVEATNGVDLDVLARIGAEAALFRVGAAVGD